MGSRIVSLNDYVNHKSLRFLALPSNIRLGEAIARSGEVEILESAPAHIVARVKPRSGVRRKVELSSTEQGLEWKCTCTRTGLFCKHCVAALIAASKSSAGSVH